MENHDRNQSNDEDQCGPPGEGSADAKLDRRATGAHDAGIDQANKRNEKPDANGDCAAHLPGNRAEDCFPEAGKNEDEDEDALPEHQSHRLLVGQTQAEPEVESDEGVEAHPGCHREREVGEDAHEDGENARD